MKIDIAVMARRIDEDTVEITEMIGGNAQTVSRFIASASERLLAMQFHPKCGECRHWGDGRYTTPIVDELPCALTYEPEFDGWDWTNGLTDYCNKWEAK